jgi:hypothetical protein
MSSELPSGATGRFERVDLQNGEVVLLVDAEHLGGERLAVAHGDRDARRCRDDVRVRHDRSLRVGDEPRASPAPTRSPDCRPIIQSNGIDGHALDDFGLHGDDDGATRATASVIAVRRDAETDCGAVAVDFGTV